MTSSWRCPWLFTYEWAHLVFLYTLIPCYFTVCYNGNARFTLISWARLRYTFINVVLLHSSPFPSHPSLISLCSSRVCVFRRALTDFQPPLVYVATWHHMMKRYQKCQTSSNTRQWKGIIKTLGWFQTILVSHDGGLWTGIWRTVDVHFEHTARCTLDGIRILSKQKSLPFYMLNLITVK